MLQQPAGQPAQPLPLIGAGQARNEGLNIVSCITRSRRSDARDTAGADMIGYDVSIMDRRATHPERSREMRQIERDLFWLLAEMPLADRIEFARLSRWSEHAVYQRLGDLQRAGLVEDLTHASELIRPTRWFLLSARGSEGLALTTDRNRESLLREYPVSELWRHVLVGRLDMVAVIYWLASALAEVKGPVEDHDAIPLVLVAFEDGLAADHFLRIAHERQQRSNVRVPLFVSDQHPLGLHKPFGPVWRSPAGSGSGHPFRFR